MRHLWVIFCSVWAIVALAIGWMSGPETIRKWVLEPVFVWRDSQRALNVKLLELSESPEIASVGRRLLQPLGVVHLRRIIDLPSEPAATPDTPRER